MAKAQVKLSPNEDDIRTFLENVLDRRWFHLLSGNPRAEKKGGMRGFVTDDIEVAITWLLEQHARGHNPYFQVNTPSQAQSKKANKDELRVLRMPHVDIDIPKDIRRDSEEAEQFIDDAIERLWSFKGVPGKPSIIMSGNGVQGLWPLAKPLKATRENIARLEDINLRLMAEFGAPAGTHDATRVLRVPGLANYPGPAKKERGYGTVMAELVYASHDLFHLDDFAGLAAPPTSKTRKSATRVDYTRRTYRDTYQPFTFEDFARHRPDITAIIKAKLDDADGDRSPACYSFLWHVAEFMATEQRCAVEDLLDDSDVLKNMCEIFVEGAERLTVLDDIMERYFESENGLGLANMGYDAARCLNDMADDGVGYTVIREKKARERQKSASLAEVPLLEISPLEARTEVLLAIRGAMANLSVLPHFIDKSNRQPMTEANVRVIMEEAGIVARWDAMRDEARFTMRKDAGSVNDRDRPRQLWERAVSASHADTRAEAEESLLCDALASFGITTRKELSAMFAAIAKEHRFHPIEDYCKRRAWDGRDRIKELAACIHTDHPLAETYIRLHFRKCIAAVKSLRNYLKTGDGQQIDTVTILDGPQGIGKSTFWRKVTPDGFMSKGSSLRLGTHGENDSKRECLSALVCCLNEYGHTQGRSEANALKDFIAQPSDEFRVAFGRVPISKGRMTAFCATANDLQLFDRTGSRRDLVMRVTGFDWPGIEAILEGDGTSNGLQQIFAQAWQEVMIEDQVWWLSREDDLERERYNEAYRAVSEEEERIAAYLARESDQHVRRWLNATEICKVLDLRYSPSKWPMIKDLLLRQGLTYRKKVTSNDVQYQRVFGFPVLPETYVLISGGSSGPRR